MSRYLPPSLRHNAETDDECGAWLRLGHDLMALGSWDHRRLAIAQVLGFVDQMGPKDDMRAPSLTVGPHAVALIWDGTDGRCCSVWFWSAGAGNVLGPPTFSERCEAGFTDCVADPELVAAAVRRVTS